MEDSRDILKRYWGYDSFRPLQEEIIDSVLSGRDTLALLPTGGGKSICYQVPALAREGICIVVSPLIALMKDQVENLRRRGIMAMAIYSGLSRRMIVQQLKNAASGPYKVLYVSPERIETSLFREYLPALHVNLIAVDEAHCISQWGYDFRPSYLNIARLREELPDVPVLALTASATAEVERDICEKLQFRKAQFFRQSYERKNLSYSAIPADAKTAKLVQVVKKMEGTAIIYCKSRRRTAELASLLQLQGIAAGFYHAGLPEEERSRRQEAWMRNKTRVMVCTNAFGMGIDKPDVRLVVHADLPDSLEHYYQEAGRAGRDGKKSWALLLYTGRDLEELHELHRTRYPSLDRIKAVYSALVNFLQIPVHTGMDQSFPFRIDVFTRNFRLDVQEVLYSLKALESDGWIDFNERSFTPSTLSFITSKRGLYEFYAGHPEFEELLTILLRTYEGIFDFPVFISELQVAQLLRMQEAEVVSVLKKAAAFGILSYTPKSDEPHLIFRRNRVAVEDLRFDSAAYEKRRAAFRARVEMMIRYVQGDGCRSRFINTYFGDTAAGDCGICDRCRQKGSAALAPAELDTLNKKVTGLLQKGALPVPALIDALDGVPEEKAWQAIRFLQAEQKIGMNAEGLICLKDR